LEAFSAALTTGDRSRKAPKRQRKTKNSGSEKRRAIFLKYFVNDYKRQKQEKEEYNVKIRKI
jgi:hypothetical protein